MVPIDCEQMRQKKNEHTNNIPKKKEIERGVIKMKRHGQEN